MTPIKDTTPRRFMIHTTKQKMSIFISVCEKDHLDRDTVINELMLDYIKENLDDDRLLKYVENIWDSP